MNTIKKEIESNFAEFKSELKHIYDTSSDQLTVHNNLYLQSYERIVSFQAWKAYVLEDITVDDSLNFFIEAQNDALLSHCLARIGSWRLALMALRSALENTLFYLYYKDHNVELSLWQLGKHNMHIADYETYIERHPKFVKIDAKTSGIEILKKEYNILSKAVHASSVKFRMTDEDYFPALTLPDLPHLNQWIAREKETLKLINQLMITMFNDHIQGAKLQNLRKTISLTIPKCLHLDIKKELDVRLYS